MLNIQKVKHSSEMSFSEFADAMKPSGAVNRLPAIGMGADVYSYSVYMNGPMATTLPIHSQEQHYKDVMLHALTEKMKLNPASPRDNLKVAEIVAVRGAWMSAVLERSFETAISAQVAKDYELLTTGMTHPWIDAELDKQRVLASKLKPSMAWAGIAKDVIPNETSAGKVVAQDSDFTFQKTNDGEVVTHENRCLNAIPMLGSEVLVSYYRGTGQVINSLANLKVSPPFVDPGSSDLAVMLKDGQGIEQVLLFNSLVGFGKFVSAHGLDTDLVRQALDIRAASPKAAPSLPRRELVKPPYVDISSGCLAVDYQEGGVIYSALFRNAAEMASLAKEFDLGVNAIAMGQSLEDSRQGNADNPDVAEWKGRASEAKLRSDLKTKGLENYKESGIDGLYIGKIVGVGPLHVAQDIGRRVIVIHDIRLLDKVAAVGDSLTIKFDNGRGRVLDMAKASGKDVGR
jgi:hypothetical protein